MGSGRSCVHHSGAGGGKGIWLEHVAEWERWKKANPKGGKIVNGIWTQNPFKVTKKSAFSSPQRNYMG
jgi:hypothetical protein